MNALQKVFDYQGARVRTIVNDGQPWFIAKDVCLVLEIGNVAQALIRVDEDEKDTIILNDGTPGNPMTLIVNEPGLYSLILASRKPEAKSFKRWITHEVIPSIRKHGAYMTPDTLESMITSPEFGIKLLTALKEEQDKRKALEITVDKQKPLVAFAETCMASKDSIKVGELAKIASKNGIIIGQNRLWNQLRKWEHIIPGTTEPYQRYIDNGYYEVVQMGKELASGARIFKVMRVTPKGQVYIMNRLRNERMANAG